MSEDVYLQTSSGIISGWQTVRITRGIERCPSDFEFTMTECYADELKELHTITKPGDSCQVKLIKDSRSDVVISGYVDRLAISIAPGDHSIHVTGRGKCQDLVDCSAEWRGGQIVNSDVTSIAKKLAAPYGIVVTSDLPGGHIPQFNIMWGETAYDIIERVCRYQGMLPYETSEGNLHLSMPDFMNLGRAAGAFTEGVNVERANIVYGVDQRYQKYEVRRMALDTLADLGQGGDLLRIATDNGITRNRKKRIVAETGDGLGADFAELRAWFECSRRIGRASQLRLTTDTWRDAKGDLWEPGTLVSLDLPSLKLVDKSWLISEVTYHRDMAGTHADLVIMMPEAFSVEPIPRPPLSDVRGPSH